jgi:hypothetical protein
MASTIQDDREPWKVAASIAVFFPLGLYWLWKHPTLGKNKVWWRCAIAYVLFGLLLASMQDRDTGTQEDTRQAAESASSESYSSSRESHAMRERGRGGPGADQAVQNLINSGNYSRKAERTIRDMMETARRMDGQK